MFAEVKLPEGELILPGVIDSTTNFIEHPELVAQRIVRYVRYAELVGQANVIASSDCVLLPAPPATWRTRASHGPSWRPWPRGRPWPASTSGAGPTGKGPMLAAMAEGAAIASEYLWGRPER